MAWIIITVIAGIAFAVCIFGAMVAQPAGEDTFGRGGWIAGMVVTVVVWAAISIGLSIHLVGQRQVGIVHNFSGTITGKVDPGVAWTAPWQGIAKENVGILRENFTLDDTNAAVSRDQQPVYASLALNYQVQPAQVVGLYKSVGPSWKQTLLDSRVLQDFKQITATYTAQEITTKREQLRRDTKALLDRELKPYDIRVIDFFVTNLGYSQAYRDAINAKNVQVQQALQAEAKVAQSRAEADQEVAQANGDARATVARAKAQATALALKGNALRKNPEVLQLEAIDKLNPNATVVYCTGTGQGNCPGFLPAAGQ